MKLIDPTVEFLDGDSDRNLVIKHSQEINAEFLESIRQARFESTQRPMGDFHRFASVPTAVVEKWKREGFDVMKEPAKAIIRKLQSEDLGAFITTNKVL
jgi:hypothetical protein